MIQEDAIPLLPPLSKEAQAQLNRITSGEFLGASRNIRQINDLFLTLCEDPATESGRELVEKLLATGDYLISTRGKNTPAIGNAIRLMLKDIEKQAEVSVTGVREVIAERRESYNAMSLQNKKLMAAFGANLLQSCQTLFAFDYSSTMIAILDELADRAVHLKIIVPESRVLDGGRPIANEATDKGHSVHFIIDMAFPSFLRQSDAVLIGSETIFANGDCWNTIGSYSIAALARMYGVPYYVATELIKIDPRSFVGLKKPMILDDHSKLLKYPETFRHTDLVSVTGPEMDQVPGSLITAYITPRGILLPEHIRGEALQFLESINAPVLPE